MNSLIAVRLAVVLSSVSAVFSLVLFSLALGGERGDSARLAVPQGQRDADATDNEVLAQIAELRAELEALRDSCASGSRREVLATETLDDGVGASDDGDRAGDERSPTQAMFSVREDLLRSFASLSDEDRKAALATLGELARWGDAQARDLLVTSLSDSSAGVRARAIRELAQLDDPALMEHLRVAAFDSSRSVRAAVADALHRMPRDEAGPILVQMLSDQKKDVVLEALRSIDDLNYDEAIPYLREQLAVSDLDLAVRVASLLQEMDDKSAADATVERILTHLAAEDISGRVRDVKRLRLVRARSQLQRIVDSDPSSTVRYEAQKALATLED